MEFKTVNFLNDNSWKDEIFEFVESIINNTPIQSGNSNDALETMKLVYKIYSSDQRWCEKYQIPYNKFTDKFNIFLS